jgi:hypothetical protein
MLIFGKLKTLGEPLGEKKDSSDSLKETLALFAATHHIQPFEIND